MAPDHVVSPRANWGAWPKRHETVSLWVVGESPNQNSFVRSFLKALAEPVRRSRGPESSRAHLSNFLAFSRPKPRGGRQRRSQTVNFDPI